MFKYCEFNLKKCECKIKEKKIFIKYENEEERCINLLVGNLGENSEIYKPDILINFPNKKLLEVEFDNFIDSIQNLKKFVDNSNYAQSIYAKIEQSKLTEHSYYNHVKFFINSPNKYPGFSDYAQSNNNKINRKKIQKEKIIKAFIYYYLNNQKLISNNKNDIDIDSRTKYCFLINKSWMDKFKKFYYYNDFSEIMEKILSDDKLEKYIKSNGYNILNKYLFNK